MMSTLEEELATAHGLAIAATVVAAKVEGCVTDAVLRRELVAMRDEARETRARCLQLEEQLGEEKSDELRGHANTIAQKASDLAVAWFKAGTGPLEAWSFLAMGEAGEVAAWSAVGELAAAAGAAPLAELAGWALPIQRRHLNAALEGATRLAAACYPDAPRWG